MNANTSRRLWAVFLAVVEFEYGNPMDEQKEREAIELMEQQCAEIDVGVLDLRAENFLVRFSKGLTSGTANADTFSAANVLTEVNINLCRNLRTLARLSVRLGR
jgi:hypothetical protein